MYNNYFLLRHGQTIYQTKYKDIIYPWPEKSPIGLTKKGKNQIKKVAEILKSREIELIFSSDFFRTHQTAEIIARELCLPILFDKRLHEINLGIYRGRPKAAYQKIFSHPKVKFSKRPPKGENWNDVKKRMLNFIKELEKKYRNKNILIISHGDPLWLLKGGLEGFTQKNFLGKENKNKYPKVGTFRKIP